MIDDPDAPSDPDMLAAEYALGLLDSDGRESVEERIRSDPEFEQQVLKWEAFGHRWAGLAPHDPDWSPDELWKRMEPAFQPRTDLELPQPANDREATGDTPRRVTGWRLGTLAASFAAMVLGGLYVGERDRARQSGERLAIAEAQIPMDASSLRVAQVSEGDGSPLLTVLYEQAEGKLTARIATIASEDLVPELWVIGPDGQPRSLGQSTSGSVVVIELTEQMRADIAAGSSIAISLEEAAEEPSVQPTAERILGAARLAPVT